MQKFKMIKLADGDSAIIIRNNKDEKGYDVEIIHHFPREDDASEEEMTFFTLMLRGMADYAMNNPEPLIEQGQRSFASDFNQLHTIH